MFSSLASGLASSVICYVIIKFVSMNVYIDSDFQKPIIDRNLLKLKKFWWIKYYAKESHIFEIRKSTNFTFRWKFRDFSSLIQDGNMNRPYHLAMLFASSVHINQIKAQMTVWLRCFCVCDTQYCCDNGWDEILYNPNLHRTHFEFWTLFCERSTKDRDNKYISRKIIAFKSVCCWNFKNWFHLVISRYRLNRMNGTVLISGKSIIIATLIPSYTCYQFGLTSSWP